MKHTLSGVLFVYLGQFMTSLWQCMTSNDIAFWSMIGTWVAGVATFVAALVALYLGHKKPSISLKRKLEVVRSGRASLLKITCLNNSVIPVTIRECRLVDNCGQVIVRILNYSPTLCSPNGIIDLKFPVRMDPHAHQDFYIDLAPVHGVSIRHKIYESGVNVHDLSLLLEDVSGKVYKEKISSNSAIIIQDQLDFHYKSKR